MAMFHYYYDLPTSDLVSRLCTTISWDAGSELRNALKVIEEVTQDYSEDQNMLQPVTILREAPLDTGILNLPVWPVCPHRAPCPLPQGYGWYEPVYVYIRERQHYILDPILNMFKPIRCCYGDNADYNINNTPCPIFGHNNPAWTVINHDYLDYARIAQVLVPRYGHNISADQLIPQLGVAYYQQSNFVNEIHHVFDRKNAKFVPASCGLIGEGNNTAGRLDAPSMEASVREYNSHSPAAYPWSEDSYGQTVRDEEDFLEGDDNSLQHGEFGHEDNNSNYQDCKAIGEENVTTSTLDEPSIVQEEYNEDYPEEDLADGYQDSHGSGQGEDNQDFSELNENYDPWLYEVFGPDFQDYSSGDCILGAVISVPFQVAQHRTTHVEGSQMYQTVAAAAAMFKAPENPQTSEIPIIKDVYVEATHIAEMPYEEAQAIRCILNNMYLRPIQSQGDTSLFPNPIKNFGDCFRMYPRIMELLENRNITVPTGLHRQIMPCIMKGMNVLGISPEGTGKILAFVLPALVHILHQPEREQIGPSVLVLVASRSTAIPLRSLIDDYYGNNFACTSIISLDTAIPIMKKGVKIVIAIPTCLSSILQERPTFLNQVSMVVVHGASQIFEEMENFTGVWNIFSQLRKDVQKVIFSTVWPNNFSDFKQKFFLDAYVVASGLLKEQENQIHYSYDAGRSYNKKLSKVTKLLENLEPGTKVCIFPRYVDDVEQMYESLRRRGIETSPVTPTMLQTRNSKILSVLESGNFQVLITPDYITRNYPNVRFDIIINFSFPKTAEQYVSRISDMKPTGGQFISYFDKNDLDSATSVVYQLVRSNRHVPERLHKIVKQWEKSLWPFGNYCLNNTNA